MIRPITSANSATHFPYISPASGVARQCPKLYDSHVHSTYRQAQTYRKIRSQVMISGVFIVRVWLSVIVTLTIVSMRDAKYISNVVVSRLNDFWNSMQWPVVCPKPDLYGQSGQPENASATVEITLHLLLGRISSLSSELPCLSSTFRHLVL